MLILQPCLVNNNIMKTKDEKGDPPAKKDSQMLDKLDLHAPDIYLF